MRSKQIPLNCKQVREETGWETKWVDPLVYAISHFPPPFYFGVISKPLTTIKATHTQIYSLYLNQLRKDLAGCELQLYVQHCFSVGKFVFWGWWEGHPLWCSGLLLVLSSGNTPGYIQETISSVKDQTSIGCIKTSTSTPVLSLHSLWATLTITKGNKEGGKNWTLP